MSTKVHCVSTKINGDTKMSRNFKNALEIAVAHALEDKGIEYQYETEKITYNRTYIPDFIVNDTIFEVKGEANRSELAKIQAVVNGLPYEDIDIKRFVLVVQVKYTTLTDNWHIWRYDNKSLSGSTLSNIQLCLWCEKNHIEYVPITYTDHRHLYAYLRKRGMLDDSNDS